MRIKYWILSFVTIFMLFFTSGCNGQDIGKNKDNNNLGEILKLNNEIINQQDELISDYVEEEKTPVWTFPAIDDIGEWDIETPGLSPYGKKENYKKVDYTKSANETFHYIDEDQIYRERVIYGKLWKLTVSRNPDLTEEENQQFMYDYKGFLEKNGGKFIGKYKGEWVYYINNNGHWWASIKVSSSEVLITIMKENRLEINEKKVIKPEEYDKNEVTYTVEFPDDKFLSLVSSIDKGYADIKLKLENNYGDYERRLIFEERMDEKKGLKFVYDDFIYESGFGYITVKWYKNGPPTTIDMMIEGKYDVKPIQYGEQLGGIKLSSDLVDKVTLKPALSEDLHIVHPEFDQNALYFDKTENEEFITFVPAGYYELEVNLKEGIVDGFKTLRVPVHSGKMTEVDVPQSFTDAFKNDVQAGEERGIFISDVEEKDKKVSFVFSLLDETTKLVLPDKENTEVFEGGMPCELLSVNPIPTPPSVVLLLDSSGSMKGKMGETVEAAKTFVKGLPENTKITVVDFDTTPKPLKGKTIEELLKELDSVKANGATALYDSVLLGIDNLKDAERPTLVVFTDGEDANWNDTARGSKSTNEEALNTIKSAGIPLYTIGFGEGHDSKTLENFAELSLGKYYPADDQNALNGVFAAINEKLGSTYLATYKRPEEASVSDIPVVSFVIDTSGSMFSNFYDGCDFRLDDVKKVYHEFIQELPKETQIQITEFNDGVSVQQGLTTDKVLALNAIGTLEAGGGTDILHSVRYSYQALKKVPSSKKILIYLTDAALEVEESDKPKFDKTLEKIKNDDIQVLWVGMGLDDTKPFEEAANKTDGHYVVSEDINVLTEKFNTVLKEVKLAKGSNKTAITLKMKKKSDDGAFESFSQTVLHNLSPVPKSDEVILSETVTYDSKDVIKQYDNITSKYFTGDTIPAETTVISKRIPANSKGKNQAAEVCVKEIMFSSKINGVEAPKGQRFMGVLIDMKNILPEQEVVVYPDGNGHPSSWVKSSDKGKIVKKKIPYVIPNFTSHFGMSYNGEGPFPAATATWLTYEPIVVPGEYDITLLPDKQKTGMIVFIVPDASLEQLGIHYYDDNYGYMDIPVVDVIPKIRTEYNPSTKSATKLLQNFDMEITGHNTIDVIEKPILNSQHRVVESNFKSEVKASLNVEPNKGMYLRFPTENGDLYSKLSPYTSSTPLGFYSPRTLTPGSRNPVRMIFQMPQILESYNSELFLDLQDDDAVVKVTEGGKISGSSQYSFDHEYFKADINKLTHFSETIFGRNWDWVIADVTIHDKKDGFATRGISRGFYCEYIVDEEAKKAADAKVSKEGAGLGNFAASNTYGWDGESRLKPDHSVSVSDWTSRLLFGIDEETIVYDGTSRRGYMLFQVSKKELTKEWFLRFDDKEDVKFLVNNDEDDGDYTQLLVQKEEYEVDTSYEKNLEVALKKAVAEYKLSHPEIERTKVVKDDLYDEVIMPSINSYGYKLASQITTVEELQKIIKSLRFIPTSSYVGFEYMISKEALLTQGFGTEGDMANMAIEILSRLGYKTKRIAVELTDKGKEVLGKMSGIDKVATDKLPAISYYNDQGEKKVLVLPFGRDLKELKGLVYYDNSEANDYKSNTQALTVYYDVKQTKEGHAAQIGGMANALGGGTVTDNVTRKDVKTFYIPLSTYSEDAIDIGTAIVGRKAYPVIMTAEGTKISEEYIDLAHYRIVGMGIKIDGTDHYAPITEEMGADQVFMTIGYNLPELPLKPAELISKQMEDSKELKADTLAALKWLHRKSIYNFIASQTGFERKMDKEYNLVTGRIENPRAIVVQSVIDDDLTMSIDLLRIQNDIYTGEKEAHKSYRLMSGLAASQLESKALPNNGYGLEKIWNEMPKDAYLVLFNSNDIEKHLEDMKSIGMSKDMIDYFENISKMVIIQSEPTIIKEKPRWAWLEIDPYTYETISVLDTFEHGSLSSNATLNSMLEKAQYIIGAFKGVETSVWAVSSFSLELTDYKAIKKSAKAFALGIGENFEVEIGPIKISGGSKPELNDDLRKIVDFFKKDKGDKDKESKGFKEGYKEGVEFYFKMAE